jgi:hypothetical protein
LIERPFDEVSEADVRDLISRRVTERRTLDYKLSLPGSADRDVREFLADVVSMANASGGDILFGIDDLRDGDGKPTGMPREALGLGNINVEAEILRLENVCRDCISPRLVGMRIRPLYTATSGPLLLVRIPRSFAAPHMAKHGGWTKFYSRNSAGKYELDVHEIRAAFVGSESLAERIRSFRQDRLGRIVADETPVPVAGPSRIVAHIVPASFSAATQVDVHSLELPEVIPPITSGGFDSRINLDGIVSHAEQFCYLQLFRNGSLEAVDGTTLAEYAGKKYIPSVEYERVLLDVINRYQSLARRLAIEPPWFVMVSLLGVKDYVLGLNHQMERRFPLRDQQRIDRSDIVLPEVVVDDAGKTSTSILRPIADMIWQAAGFTRSANFDLVNDRWLPG